MPTWKAFTIALRGAVAVVGGPDFSRSWQETPTLFDRMTIAYTVKPGLCPVQPIRIRVGD
jgi:hypothetical protein